MKKNQKQARGDAGFSLIELIVAMGVTVIVMGIAASLIASAVNVRAREDRRSDALADVRRALNTMTREIGNSGFGLPTTLAGNGIVAADSNSTQIRVLTNPDRFSTDPATTPNSPTSADEDVLYQWVNDAQNNQSYILRFDVNSSISGTTILANRVDSFVIRYYDQRVTYQPGTCQQGIDTTTVRNAGGVLQAEVAPSQASYVVIAVCVQLPQVGTPGSPGYQAASRTQLISDVELRNASAKNY
jgi:prepilin-type N-terminal cleavage/methylation domain-containing protein